MEETVEIEFTKDELTEKREKAQFERMTKTPIPRLIVSLGIPTMLNMMVTSLYNMADTLFVSRLGEQAVGAVSVVLSLMSIIQAIGFTLGMGAGSLVSSLLGKRDQKGADTVASVAFYSALIIGLILTVTGLCFLDPLVRVLGATEEAGVVNTTLDYAKIYSTYILISAPLMCMSFVMNNLLRSQGKALTSMIGLCTGAILNIALDPILIYGANMGVAGAAVATMVSQTVSFGILIFIFFSGKTITNISLKRLVGFFPVLWGVVVTGFPSFCRQILASLCTVLLNNLIQDIEGAQAAFGVVHKIFMLAFSISLGIGQGYQPVLGYNYSAGKYGRVRSAYHFTLRFATAIMAAFAIVCAIVAPLLMRAFLETDSAIKIGTAALRFQCIAMPLLPVNFMAGLTYQVVGNKLAAAVLSVSRQGLFYIPLIFILPPIAQLTGIECMQAVSDVLSFLFALPFTFYFLKGLKRAEQTGEAKNVGEYYDGE
ncbi:MAG: MATE family efflux transporter [Clostridiales bacterium]|nr:MATE family efflux transporter [Clostridiales bacterium]